MEQDHTKGKVFERGFGGNLSSESFPPTSPTSPTPPVAVIGAGHAGIEAALAAARLGVPVLCFATQLDSVGNLPCNPAIGGTAKGHLVREIDALGGEMAKAADACCIQYRMLNRGKGPAVHSLRAQADRRRYQEHMKHILETTPGVYLRQAEIIDITVSGGSYLLTSDTGMTYTVGAVVLATGTFLGGRIITGAMDRPGGPDGLLPAKALSDALGRLGISLRRFKTGTPPRVLARSIDFSCCQCQPGEDTPPFSFATDKRADNQVCCWLTYTTAHTHAIIRENLHRSPLFSGVIEGIGARYCPSIEDKVVRFAGKERHPVFLEPMGLQTTEIYLQGLSSSLPPDVQEAVVHSIPGLEAAEITRYAYAIEYDCLEATCLTSALMFTELPGLFAAGQVCGSSGYEEAAAQGLVAGINAARFLTGKEPFTLARSSSYIGTLIDDLVVRGTDEPYRCMTSRSEYRLLLRQDNADERLMPLGYALGLLPAWRLQACEDKYRQVDKEILRLERLVLPPTDALNTLLAAHGSAPVRTGIKAADLLRRPEMHYALLFPDAPLPSALQEIIDIRLTYEGYLKRQESHITAMRRQEEYPLPASLDYEAIQGLRIEARQKLTRRRPATLGQAARIPGVSPADITALMLTLSTMKNRENIGD